MIWSAVYILSIVLVNYLFTVVPVVHTPLGVWPPMSLAVGCIFLFRDYAQRAAGHKVLWATMVGIGVSYVMADPHVAIASAVAFALSELTDWLIYTITKRPFEDRVLLSSLVATPLDSIVFLSMIGFLSPAAVLLMTASKMVAAVVLAVSYKQLRPKLA